MRVTNDIHPCVLSGGGGRAQILSPSGGSDSVTTTEAARELGVSSSTVAQWCREGKILATKVNGRWSIPEARRPQGRRSSSSGQGLGLFAFLLGGRSGMYRGGRLLGNLNAVTRGLGAIGRRLVRKSLWKGFAKAIRCLGL